MTWYWKRRESVGVFMVQKFQAPPTFRNIGLYPTQAWYMPWVPGPRANMYGPTHPFALVGLARSGFAFYYLIQIRPMCWFLLEILKKIVRTCCLDCWFMQKLFKEKILNEDFGLKKVILQQPFVRTHLALGYWLRCIRQRRWIVTNCWACQLVNVACTGYTSTTIRYPHPLDPQDCPKLNLHNLKTPSRVDFFFRPYANLRRGWVL